MKTPLLIHQMDSLDNLTPQQMAALFEVDFQRSEILSSYPTFSTSTNSNKVNPCTLRKVPQTCDVRSIKQLESITTDSWNSSTIDHASSPKASSFPNVFRFGNSVGSTKLKDGEVPSEKKCFTSESRNSKGTDVNDKCVVKAGNARKRGSNDLSACTLDHVIAERKRREKLTQQFIALSAIVPGLKRTDKISVLEDCMKYIKHMQESVRTLEDQTSNMTMESAVFVKKFLIFSDSHSSSSDEISSEVSQEPLPEVQARISGRNVLIRIHCEKCNGMSAQTLLEAEKLNLIVVGSSVLPFGNSTLDIALLAEMDAGFNMTVTSLVRKLRSSIVEFTGKKVPLN